MTTNIRSLLISMAAITMWFGGAAMAVADDAHAQDAPRPRIGLALGGGSARGIAHIGVLKWFEEHRIPIDFVAGTSMGGLVGGAYATGMSPAALQELMRTTDWDLIFLPDAPFDYKTFRRKEDARAYPSLLKFGLKGGFKVPSALSSGQQVDMLLDRISAPYYDLNSFDDLPTPFRCVATDLHKSEFVVLDHGPLAQAMRATMSIPGAFAPVEVDGRLFVDGGTLNNIPADVVRAMGATVVMAVNVGAEGNAAGTNESMFSLLGRTIDAMMTAASRRALKDADLIIDPDLTNLGGMDWRKADELVARGYAAAEKMSADLMRYSVDEATYAEFVAARDRRRLIDVPTPGALRVTGQLTRSQEAEIRKEILPFIGKPVDLMALNQASLRLMGTDRFDTLGFTFGQAENGDKALVFDARPKSYAPPFLRLSFDLNNADATSFSATVRARVVTLDTIGARSEIRADFAVGTNQFAGIELFKPIGGSNVFVSGHAAFDRDRLNGYQDDVLVSEYQVKRTGGGGDVGMLFGVNGQLAAGFEIDDVRARRRVGAPVLPEATGTERLARARYVLDGQNSPLVPSRGVYLRSELRHFLETPDVRFSADDEPVNEAPLTQAEVDGSWFKTVSPRGRIFVSGGGGTSFGDTALVEAYSVGGPLRVGALNVGQIRGSNYLLASGGYLRTLGSLPTLIGGNIYAGGWLEAGSAFEDISGAEIKSDVSMGLIVESLFGAFVVGGSVGFQGGGRFYVALGPLFRR